MTLADARSSATPLVPFALLATAIPTAIYGLPTLVVAAPFVLELPRPLAFATLALAPLLWTTAFLLTAGLLSRPFHRAITPGKFPRALTHPIYRARRLYGLCWTCVYYNKPAYYLALTIPLLKRITFRLFGYRGSLDFTIYPDTWIRDLPILDFAPGSYIANRATLGTNMALSNGSSLVGAIRIGAGATVGHLAVLAPGTTIGDAAEIGARATLGINVTIGAHALVQPVAAVNHAARIGAHATVGTQAYVGAATVVEPHAVVPPAAHLANRSRHPARPEPPPGPLAPESRVPAVRPE